MANEILEKCQRIVNRFSDMRQPFIVVYIVIIQPSEREIYLAQIELWERTPCISSYPTVEEYIHRKQYEEANDIDDIRMGEYKLHIYDKTRRAYVKWCEEGPDGAGCFISCNLDTGRRLNLHKKLRRHL